MNLKLNTLQHALKCPHCNLLFEEPKLLPCGASMCLKCLESVRFQVSRCSTCSDSHQIDPKNLKTNPVVIEYLTYFKQQQQQQQQQQKPQHQQQPQQPQQQHHSDCPSKSLTTSMTHLYDNMDDCCSRSRSKSQPPSSTVTNSLMSDSTRMEIGARLETYMRNLESKIDVVNNGYANARAKIENEFNQISEEVNQAAKALIMEIIRKRDTMIKDIESYKSEMLVDYHEKFEHNPAFEHVKEDVNRQFAHIQSELDGLDCKTCEPERLRYLLQCMERLNAKINDNQRLLPDTDVKIGLKFAANRNKIDVPFIGDITYESIYKIDVKSKILSFNNDYQHRMFDFSSLMSENPLTKNIGIISKNKFLVLCEKIWGKVKVTYAKIVYYDGSILAERQIAHVGNLLTYLIYDKNILIAFKNSEKNCIVHLLDLNLVHLKESDFNYNISYMLMNEKLIYIIAEKPPIINEYDMEFNYRNSFGQITNDKKPFFVNDEIIAINNEKIFVKYGSTLRLVCRATGSVLYTVDKIDDLKQCTVFLDYNKEKYIVFNGYDKVVYYNHKGDVIANNKLRGIKEKIDEFQYSRSGHFAFINYESSKVLVI